MRVLVLIWLCAAMAHGAGELFAHHGAAARTPDLFLVALVVLALFTPPRWVPIHAACLALVRAPWTLCSPVSSLATYLVIAQLLLGMRRALVARGPLFLIGVGVAAYGLQHLLHLVLPGADPRALPALSDLWVQAALTGLLVPLLAAVARSAPLLRGAFQPGRM